MYLFSRSSVAAVGKLAEALEPSVEIAEHVSSLVGSEVTVFMTRFGAPIGTISWSMRIEDFAHADANTEKLAADSAYLDKEHALAPMFMTPATDSFGRYLVDPGDGPRAPFYAVTTATMRAGQYPAGFDFGTRAAHYIGDNFAAKVAFLAATSDGFGDVAWTTALESADEVDRMNDWMITDAGYHDLLAQAAELFVDGSGHRRLVQKVS